MAARTLGRSQAWPLGCPGTRRGGLDRRTDRAPRPDNPIEAPSPQHRGEVQRRYRRVASAKQTPTVGAVEKIDKPRVGKSSLILAAQIKSSARREEHCCQRTKMDLEDAPQEDPDAGLSVGTVHAAFILSAAVAVALTFGKDLIKGKLSMNSDVGGQTPQFKAFQRTYLTVYLLMMAGDWLQGPYMYALYDAYGFKHEEIAALFVAGFFSGAEVNTISTRLLVLVATGSRRWRKG